MKGKRDFQMVSCPRIAVWSQVLHRESRFMVRRVHHCGNDHQTSSIRGQYLILILNNIINEGCVSVFLYVRNYGATDVSMVTDM